MAENHKLEDSVTQQLQYCSTSLFLSYSMIDDDLAIFPRPFIARNYVLMITRRVSKISPRRTSSMQQYKLWRGHGDVPLLIFTRNVSHSGVSITLHCWAYKYLRQSVARSYATLNKFTIS
jgi:hypothetical protein